MSSPGCGVILFVNPCRLERLFSLIVKFRYMFQETLPSGADSYQATSPARNALIPLRQYENITPLQVKQVSENE